MRIHLHVGVHKTATTFVQGMLRGSQAALSEAGVGYLPMGQVRQWLTRTLMTIDPRDFDIEANSDRFFPADVPAVVTGIVLSDENLLGDCTSFVRTGVAYEHLEQRLRRLRLLLAGHDVSLFCAVRSYDTFPVSAYCEGVRHGGFVPFHEFESRIHWPSLRWPLIVHSMEQALRPTRTRIWRWEDFRDHADLIVSELAFGTRLPVAVDDVRPERRSFSQVAVDTLHVVAESQGQDVASTLVRPVTDSLPKTADRPAFQPWSPDRVEQLKDRYVEDCRLLPADRWLVPPELSVGASA